MTEGHFRKRRQISYVGHLEPALTVFRVVLGQPIATHGSQRGRLDGRLASPHGEGGDHNSHDREERTDGPESDSHRVRTTLRDPSRFAGRDLPEQVQDTCLSTMARFSLELHSRP